MSRLVCAVLTAAAILLATLTIAGMSLGGLLAAWDVVAHRGGIEESRREWEGLELRGRTTFARVTAKGELTEQLLAGRIRLTQAVAEFAALVEGDPEGAALLRERQPAATAEGSACRQVLSWAATALEGRPDREEIMARLRDEARSILGHDD